MGVSLDPITLTVRGGKNHHKFGDEYDYSATVQICGDMAFISSLNRSNAKFTGSDHKAIINAVLDLPNVNRVEYVRKKLNHDKAVRIEG